MKPKPKMPEVKKPRVEIVTGTVKGLPGKWEVAAYIGDVDKIYRGGGYVIGYAKRIE